MNRINKLLFTILSVSMLSLGACKKNDKEADLTSDVTVQSDDQAMFSEENDAISNEANLVVEGDMSLGRTTNGPICDATITRDSTATTKGVTITYNDTATCSPRRKRTGVIKISMARNTRWRDVNATITIDFINYKVTRVRDNKSVVLNGTKTITNQTGGLLRNLATRGPIVHLINSTGMNATFDNATSRQWQIAKKRTFTVNSGLVISTTGTHTDGSNNDISVWGTNRLGQQFATRIITPMVVREDCNFRLVSGKIEHTKITRPITVTFGLDKNGMPVSCPAGMYYYKAEWTTAAGVARSVILPYN